MTLLLYLNPKTMKSNGDSTWTPKVCKIMAIMAVIRGLGLLFYMLLVFR